MAAPHFAFGDPLQSTLNWAAQGTTDRSCRTVGHAGYAALVTIGLMPANMLTTCRRTIAQLRDPRMQEALESVVFRRTRGAQKREVDWPAERNGVVKRFDYFDDGGTFDVEQYLYHYTSAENARLILETGNLRLGSLARANDPREAGAWYPSLSISQELGNEDWVASMNEIDQLLRLRTKVACFTTDRLPFLDSQPAGEFHRGWARARMWAQYGAGHRGAVLVLDRAAWQRSLAHELDRQVRRWHGRIVYKDVGFPPGLLHFDYDELHSRGARAVIDEAINVHVNDLYYLKNTDWRDEQEFRSVVIAEEEHVYVPLAEALLTVVVGQNCPAVDVVAIRSAAPLYDVEPNAVARCTWQAGAPSALPTEGVVVERHDEE